MNLLVYTNFSRLGYLMKNSNESIGKAWPDSGSIKGNFEPGSTFSSALMSPD